MTCYKPLDSWPSADLNETGKRSRVFNPKYALDPDAAPTPLACSQCVGCRLERSRQWAVRCMHEASQHEYNSFLTLTWDDKYIVGGETPPYWTPSKWKRYLKKKKDVRSVDKRDIKLFMKRLRKANVPENPYDKDSEEEDHERWHNENAIRYYSCGEYGEKNRRPHYHVLVFNYYPPDAQLWEIRNGQRYYISESLSRVWPFGFVTIGDLTFESAAYVARYIMKKVNGDAAEEHYNFKYVDEETGELLDSVQVEPEFTTMSTKPGIASDWFDKYYSTDLYNTDSVTYETNGRRRPGRVPKYYDNKLEKIEPFLHETIKHMRQLQAAAYQENNTPERLHVREAFKQRQIQKLVRDL